MQNSDTSEPAERKTAQQKKVRQLLRRIFKWIGLGLLVLLLITVIIFQAPWKVVTLLVIILAACTALPKPARKWFWLSTGVVVIAFIIWALLPEDDEGWRPYTFDEELSALEAKYAIPESENAAAIYNELLKSYDRETMYPDFLDRELDKLTLSEQWSSQEYPQFAQWLKEQGSTIKTLMRAVQKKTCRFPINVELVVTDKQEINRYPALKSWGHLLVRAANNDVAEGRIYQALEKYICALRIGNHLCQQHKMLDFLVGFYVENLALVQLNRFVIEGEPGTQQLKLISETSTNLQNNWSSDFIKKLESDNLFCKNAFGLFYEINSEGHIRLSRNPAAVIRNLFLDWRLGRRYLEIKPHRAYASLAWLFLPSAPRRVARIIGTSYKKYYTMAQPDFDWDREPIEPHLRFKLNYHYIVKAFIMDMNSSDRLNHSFHDSYLQQIALRRGSRLLAAIRQYQVERGAWPPNLDAIRSAAPAEAFIDPVSGGQFEYENHGKRFSLYGETINIWPK